MVNPIPHAPLDRLKVAIRAGTGAPDAGLFLSDGGRPAILNIRVQPDNTDALQLIADQLGVALPAGPDQVNSADGKTAVWLGPDIWLAIVEGGDGAALAQSLSEAVADHSHSIIDVSDNYGVITATGPQARWVLQKAVPMNLSAETFPVGRAVATNLAKAQVVVHLVDGEPTFNIYARRSFCSYVWQWLEAASRDVGFGVA